MIRKTRAYRSENITVEYEPRRCLHVGECVRGLPAVFDTNARPWIQPGKREADAVAEVVERCPTGALLYTRHDGGPEERPDDRNTVGIRPGGPLYVAGRVRIELPDGEVLEETRAALCRCGASKNKPFCDNSHRGIDFSDPGLVAERELPAAEDEADGVLTIRLAPNGPMMLAGPFEIAGARGSTRAGAKAALCRCGASEAKPYCDGSHKDAGFTAD